jgi:3,2-trans-enoyl-CoA isomerase
MERSERRAANVIKLSGERSESVPCARESGAFWRREDLMSYTEMETSNGIATVSLVRGKVNALNGAVVAELRSRLQELEADPEVRAVVLTGRDRFFSFGFDIPEFLAFSKEEFTAYLTAFTELYTYLFLYPKPVVAALNGHAIAGGCMLALACDCRVMAVGKTKISLNEISFGSSIFAGSTEMLRFKVGNLAATKILYSGALFSAEEALDIGLVDELESEEKVVDRAKKVAAELGSRPASAFASIKALLRRPVAEEMRRREQASIREFVEIWYSPSTWANLQKILIR